jgi:hypothetical protein
MGVANAVKRQDPITIDKYFLEKVDDTVMVVIPRSSFNAVVAQVVGNGVAILEVSLDHGHSWLPTSLDCLQSGELVKELRGNSGGWARVPGITSARLRLIEEDPDGPCKVNLRYGRA